MIQRPHVASETEQANLSLNVLDSLRRLDLHRRQPVGIAADLLAGAWAQQPSMTINR
jgi:hypothetical protein